MEGELQKQYELRSRSRSRSETPQSISLGVNEHETLDHHYELRSRSRERSMTPGEVSSSRRSTSKLLPSSIVKAHSKTMDTIDEHRDDTLVENVSIKSATITKSTRKTERRSERQRVKRQILANGQSELKDDSLDRKSEIKERKRESLSPKRLMTSDYSSEEGDREEVPSRISSAYEFYKQQGDYWNKFPKTDYTYSKASTCRYEVAPGVMAIPNMSRRSLHSDNSFLGSQESNSQSFEQSSKGTYEENNTMDLSEIRRDFSDVVPQILPHTRGSNAAGQSVLYKRTHVQQYTTRQQFLYDSSADNQINEKYETWANPLINSHSVNRYRPSSIAESDAELDEAVTISNHKYQTKITNKRFTKFTSLVSSWVYTLFHFVTFGQFKTRVYSATSQYYRRHEESKWSRLRQQIYTVLSYIYLIFVKLALFDTWLLSRASNIRKRVQGRRTKIIWLVLLPLLFTVGFWFLPQILSAIPLSAQTILNQIKEETPGVAETHTQEDLNSNNELRHTIDLLIRRVQQLEDTKKDQSEHLSNVTQILEEIKQSDNKMWKQYDEKLLIFERELEDHSRDREKCKTEELDFIRVQFQSLKKLYTELKTCCDTKTTDDEIRKQADEVFTSYFGDGVSKQEVAKIFQVMNSKIQQSDLQKPCESTPNPADHSNVGLDEIRKIILEILKVYDADKTGRVDYALESAGGQIISTRCTQRYDIHTRAIKILGLTLYYESNNPRTVIQGNTLQPGMCWAFQDFPGYLLIKLRSLIYVTGFSVEHAPRANLPNGEMKSAPKKFNVWGLTGENDMEPVMFGEYEFLNSDDSLQYFPVQNVSITMPYEYVEMRIHSNHGQLEYTCLYRFRVHGNLA